jgi:hypothetical protein
MLSLADYGRNPLLPAEVPPTGGVAAHWVADTGSVGAVNWHYYFMYGDHEDTLVPPFFGGEVTWGGGGGIARSVRCVGGPILLGVEELVTAPGCDPILVRDPRTGLEWEQAPPTDESTWVEALDRCNTLCAHGGGWRLPSVKELGTIFVPDEFRGVPAPPFAAVGIGNEAQFWTSTASVRDLTKAFVVNFGTDDAFQYPIRAESRTGVVHRARCVRTYTPSAR